MLSTKIARGLVLFALVCFSTVVGQPTFASRDGGTVVLPYLQHGFGARALGVGQAYSALSEGADALFWNPAGLVQNRRYELFLNHQPLLDFMALDVASLAIPVGTSSLGLAYAQMKSETIEAFDTTGNPGGSYDAKDQLIIVGFAKKMNRWSAGISGKSVHSRIATTSASTFAGDAGVNFVDPLSEKMSHAVVIQNVGGSLRYGEESNSMPLTARLGTAIRPLQPVNLGFDVILPKGAPLAVAFGGEWTTALGSETGLSLRAGYNTAQKDVGGIAGLGLGGGFSLVGLHLDYAWNPAGDFGANNVFTLSYRFQTLNKETTAQ